MKKKITFLIIAILALLIAGGSYFYFVKEDTNSSLTLYEKKWIDSNKNKLRDIGLINNVAGLNRNGEGIMFDFISDLEKKTNLEFNKISYSFDEKVEEEYAFIQTKKISKNDIIVYSDNYVLVGHENNKIFNLNDIKKENIGVLSSDIEDK